jgi:ubiquinone/menaquinone biosynthesis C-methylase UbiE
MSQHTQRFTGRAEIYERYRSRFPREIIDLLREHCNLQPEDLIADIGAGTGMFAELFLDNGNRVIAVEPNQEMRAACERLLSKYSRLEIVDAAAESTGLGDASVDLVAVGRAFHWFDRDRALAEFKRILKPRGWLVLASTSPAREGSEAALEYQQLILAHSIDYAQVRQHFGSYDDLKPFGDTQAFAAKIAGADHLTLESFTGLVESFSVMPLPGDAGHEPMLEAIRTYFAKWSSDGILRLETESRVNGWRVD